MSINFSHSSKHKVKVISQFNPLDKHLKHFNQHEISSAPQTKDPTYSALEIIWTNIIWVF